MKTLLDQIKDDYAGEQGRDSWEEYFMWLDLCHTSHSVMQRHYDEIAKRYATEYAKEVQKNAGDKRKLSKIIYIVVEELECLGSFEIATSVSEYILSEDNLPKHK